MEINEIFNMYFEIIEDERDQANVIHPLNRYIKASNDSSVMWNG